jgi:hypothetical protein
MVRKPALFHHERMEGYREERDTALESRQRNGV